MVICAFTGHRPSKVSFLDNPYSDEYMRLARRLDAALYDVYGRGARHFISGMALGFDTLAAFRVLAMKKKLPGITLEAAVPFKGQEQAWSENDVRLYRSLLGLCDKVTMLSDEYSPYVMQLRNRYMVNSAQFLIAFYNGTPGGTKSTVDHALRRGVTVINVYE